MSDQPEHDQARPTGDSALPVRVPSFALQRRTDSTLAPAPRKAVRLAHTSTSSVPLGASHAPPRVDALPERGATIYLVAGFLAAAVAGSFLVLIISKL